MVYKRCTTEKAALQQRKIEECILAVMRDKSFHDITVSSLCEQTGLSRKTFYRLYESKQDVLCALIDRTIRDFIHFRLPPEAVLRGVSEELQAFFSYWQKQHPLLDALSKNGMSTMLFERTIRHTMEEDTDILRQLGADPDHPLEKESLIFYLSGMLTLVVSWHHEGYRKTPQEMAVITEKLLTKPPIHR